MDPKLVGSLTPVQGVRPERQHVDPLSAVSIGETLAVIVKVERIFAAAPHGRLVGRACDRALFRAACGRLGAILGALVKLDERAS